MDVVLGGVFQVYVYVSTNTSSCCVCVVLSGVLSVGVLISVFMLKCNAAWTHIRGEWHGQVLVILCVTDARFFKCISLH